MSWVDEEFAGLDLGDRRLNRRALLVADRLGSSPHASIPQACGGWDETKGAYRLFDHPEVTASQLLAPHVERTRQRMAAHPVVLCVNDTTEVRFGYKTATTGLGPLARDSEAGFLLHPLLAVTPDRLCLGVLEAQWLVRDPQTLGHSVATKKKRPLCEKESHRWPAAFAWTCQQAAAVPNTRLVYVADRESDIYELLAAAQDAPADLLIRCSQDRALLEGGRIHNATENSTVLGEIEVRIPRSREGVARTARLTLRTVRVQLRPTYRKGEKLDPIWITAVQAREEEPPAGATRLDWMLLTNRSAETLEDAQTLVGWYVCRWQIEIYFRVLKTGCRIESLQLGDFSRIQTAVAIYLIVAWRVQFLITLGRECPELPCDALFDPEEWQAAWIVSTRTQPPREPPKLQDMIRIIAKLGGFLARKGDGEPGAMTFWTGLDAVRHFVVAISAHTEVATKARRRR